MIINIKSKKYDTSEKPLIMGILNLSTDSPIVESVTSVDLAVYLLFPTPNNMKIEFSKISKDTF